MTTDKQYLNDLYFALLGREPDRYGFDFHLDTLSEGLSRERILRNFIMTPEFAVHYAKLTAEQSETQ